jgi:hypothetical protein
MIQAMLDEWNIGLDGDLTNNGGGLRKNNNHLEEDNRAVSVHGKRSKKKKIPESTE